MINLTATFAASWFEEIKTTRILQSGSSIEEEHWPMAVCQDDSIKLVSSTSPLIFADYT